VIIIKFCFKNWRTAQSAALLTSVAGVAPLNKAASDPQVLTARPVAI